MLDALSMPAKRSTRRWLAASRPAASLALALFLLVVPGSAVGQQPADELRALRQEIEALRQEQTKLRGEIQALRELLQRERAAGARRPAQGQSPPDAATLSLGDHPTKGDPNAKLVLVEFTDYQ